MYLLGGSAAAVTLGTLPGVTPQVRADKSADTTKEKKPERAAEALVKELFASLTDEQKKQAVYPWDHVSRRGGIPTRLGMYNSSLGTPIGKIYSKQQQDLILKLIKTISNGDDGYKQISRNGGWDASGALTNCGAHIFGNPTTGQYSWVLSGHHLTIRCDGDSE